MACLQRCMLGMQVLLRLIQVIHCEVCSAARLDLVYRYALQTGPLKLAVSTAHLSQYTWYTWYGSMQQQHIKTCTKSLLL